MLISSDTNIWIDFFEINHPDHKFLLLPTINVAAMLMSNDAIDLVQEKI